MSDGTERHRQDAVDGIEYCTVFYDWPGMVLNQRQLFIAVPD